jgi:hypothetical protein
MVRIVKQVRRYRNTGIIDRTRPHNGPQCFNKAASDLVERKRSIAIGRG